MFPPVGDRGCSVAKGQNDFAGQNLWEFTAEANRENMIILQIERAKAVEDIDELLSVPGVGEPINPQGIKGQIEGGIVMGMGYGLSEEFRLEAGRPVTVSYGRLGLPRITDTPEMVSISISNAHPEGPYGAKGMGELPMSPAAAAIANAVYDATGVRVQSLPITPEKIAAAREVHEA